MKRAAILAFLLRLPTIATAKLAPRYERPTALTAIPRTKVKKRSSQTTRQERRKPRRPTLTAKGVLDGMMEHAMMTPRSRSAS